MSLDSIRDISFSMLYSKQPLDTHSHSACILDTVRFKYILVVGPKTWKWVRLT